MAAIPLAILLALCLAAIAAAQDEAELDRRTREVAGALQCPVCQNLSAADSPSELAVQMRAVVRERLAVGETREQVLAYFVDRYGEEILIDPPKRGFHLIIWLVPPLLLVAFGAVTWRSVVRWRRRASVDAQPHPAADTDRARYGDRLRRDLGSV